MTTKVDDEIVATGHPFLRLVQPESPTAFFTDSSYFRLGSYVRQNGEEANLVTGLKHTTSRIGPGTGADAPNAAVAAREADGSLAQSFSAASQVCLTNKAVTSAPVASTNDGILLYTDHDLNETVRGTALQRYGQGHVVSVVEGDASYAVKDGTFDLFAQNGVFVYAGSKGSPANIEITAEGNIKETSLGDLQVNVHGNTNKNHFGTSFDRFVGAKLTLTMDAELTVKFTTSLTITGGLDTTIRMGGKFTFTLSSDLNIMIGTSHNIFLGAKTDVVVGQDSKFIVGPSFKGVIGGDTKVTTRDTKFVATVDSKVVAGTDIKFVGTSATFCDIDYKKEFATVDDSEAKVEKAKVVAKFDDLAANKTSVASLYNAPVTLYL